MLIGVVIGTAYGPLSSKEASYSYVRMTIAFESANALTDWKVGARLARVFARPAERRRDSSESSPLALSAVLLIAAVALYARYADVVAEVLVFIALLSVVCVTWTFVALWRRNVIDGKSVGQRLTLSLSVSGIGLLNGVWLVVPPFNPGALDDFRANGLFGSAPDSFGAVAFQLGGAILTFAVLLTAIFYCLASSTAIYVHLRALGFPVWRLLYWTGRWTTPGWVWWTAIVAGVVSLGLSSGWFAAIVAEAQTSEIFLNS